MTGPAMTDPRPPFADRLIALDPPNPTARERYDRKVCAMLENTLSPRQRGGYLLGTVVAATTAAGLLGLSVSLFDDTGNSGVLFLRVCLALMGLAATAVAGSLLRSYWTGVVRRPGAGGWAAGLGISYLALAGSVLLLTAGHLPAELRSDTRASGGLLVVYAAVAWVRSRIARAELTTAERLLELELRLAELQDALRGGAARPGPASGQAEGVVA